MFKPRIVNPLKDLSDDELMGISCGKLTMQEALEVARLRTNARLEALLKWGRIFAIVSAIFSIVAMALVIVVMLK